MYHLEPTPAKVKEMSASGEDAELREEKEVEKEGEGEGEGEEEGEVEGEEMEVQEEEDGAPSTLDLFGQPTSLPTSLGTMASNHLTSPFDNFHSLPTSSGQYNCRVRFLTVIFLNLNLPIYQVESLYLSL